MSWFAPPLGSSSFANAPSPPVVRRLLLRARNTRRRWTSCSRTKREHSLGENRVPCYDPNVAQVGQIVAAPHSTVLIPRRPFPQTMGLEGCSLAAGGRSPFETPASRAPQDDEGGASQDLQPPTNGAAID